MDNKKKYLIANPAKRILGRLIDYTLLLILSFVINVILLNINDLNTLFKDFSNFRIEYWKLWAMVLITDSLLFSYFLIIPMLTKGYTFGIWLLKMRIMDYENKKITFKQMFFRESLITIIPILFSLLKPIFLGDTQPSKLVSLLTSDTGTWELAFFKTIEVISGFLLLLVTSSMFFIKNKKGIHDVLSYTFVVDKKPIEESFTPISKKKRNMLPGEINE